MTLAQMPPSVMSVRRDVVDVVVPDHSGTSPVIHDNAVSDSGAVFGKLRIAFLADRLCDALALGGIIPCWLVGPRGHSLHSVSKTGVEIGLAVECDVREVKGFDARQFLKVEDWGFLGFSRQT